MASLHGSKAKISCRDGIKKPFLTSWTFGLEFISLNPQPSTSSSFVIVEVFCISKDSTIELARVGRTESAIQTCILYYLEAISMEGCSQLHTVVNLHLKRWNNGLRRVSYNSRCYLLSEGLFHGGLNNKIAADLSGM